MQVYVDLPMKTGILETQSRIIQADSDPRLQLSAFDVEALRRICEASVSKNVSKIADTLTAPASHRAGTLTAP